MVVRLVWMRNVFCHDDVRVTLGKLLRHRLGVAYGFFQPFFNTSINVLHLKIHSVRLKQTSKAKQVQLGAANLDPRTQYSTCFIFVR